MKTKHVFFLQLLVVLFASCEKSEKLSAPSGLEGHQIGNSIALEWNRVNGASNYKIQRNGMFLSSVYSTDYIDNDPSNGYNFYEVYASDGSSCSQAAYVNVFFEGNSSGGNGGDNGGDSNPGGNTDTNLPITKSNIIGYWQYTQKTLSNSSTYTMSDYVYFASNGMWEEVSIESSSKCYVTYGTWSISGTTINILVEAQNCFVNGTYSFSYPAVNRTDICAVENLTSNTLIYKMGTAPYMTTYTMKRVNSIPASYQHNNDIDKGGNSNGGSSSNNDLTVNKTNLTGTWTCTFNGSDEYYWVLQSDGKAYTIVDESSYMSRGSYHKFVGTWTVNNSSFTFKQTKYYYYSGGILDNFGNDSYTEVVYISILTSSVFVDGDGSTWIRSTLPEYVKL